MVKVGLVTGPPTPSARAAPRTNVVLPAPSSPETRTTSPGRRRAASRAARASVSAADPVSVAAMGGAAAPQRQPGEHQRHADQSHGDDVEPGARELAGGGARLLRGGGGRRRRGRRGRLRLRLLLGGLGLLLGGRRRLRLGLGLRLTRERVGVLLVARAVLRARRGGGQ